MWRETTKGERIAGWASELYGEDLQKRYDETQTKLEEKVQKAVKDFMKKADVVTSDELKGLKKEIRELKKAISEGPGTSK